MKEQGLNITIEANQNLSENQMISLFTSMHSQTMPLHTSRIFQSCNEEVFNEAKPMYQIALRNSGYDYELKYEKVDIHAMNNNSGRQKRSRKRQTFWFNPVFDKQVETNVGAKFLQILDTTIPRDHVLHKLFNRHTVKVSQRTLGNLVKTISTQKI